MVKELPLQNGMVALVDDEDFERCSQYIWYAYSEKENRSVFVRCAEYSSLGKFIMGVCSQGKCVVNIDGNSLNFQKSNLVIGNQRTLAIKSKGQVGSSSKYKGVHWRKDNKRWRAVIRVDKKNINLGSYTNEDEAAEAYNIAALKYFGELAYQNVIGEDNRSNHKETSLEKTITKRYKKERKNKYRGITKLPSGKFRAYIYKDGKNTYSKNFLDKKEAACAYDSMALELHGDKAILNFPELKDTYLKENENELSRN